MRKYKFVIFDWDGCLAKTPDLLLKAFKKVLLGQGLFFQDEQIVKYMFGNWIGGLKYWGVEDPMGTIDRIKAELEEAKLELELYPGVTQTLSRLKKRGKILGLISTGYAKEVLPYLKKTGIDKYLSKVITGETFTWKKPDKRILEEAILGLKGRKADTLWVGNSMNDFVMGKAAKVETLIFYPQENQKFGDNKLLDQEVGVRVITDFKQILRIAT